MPIKIFLVLDSGMENVIVTWSISGGLIYGDGHGRKDRTGDQKTDVLDDLYFISLSIADHNLQVWIKESYSRIKISCCKGRAAFISPFMTGYFYDTVEKRGNLWEPTSRKDKDMRSNCS